MTPQWKKLSENGAKNRRSVPGGDEGASYVRHTGGSVNYSIHLERLEKEIGCEPTKLEGFTRIHKKQNGKGEWCDVRAEKAVKKYEEIMLEKHPCDDINEQSSQMPFDSQAWLEATAISKKKQPYGFPKSQEAKRKVTSPSCSTQSQPATLTPLEIEEHIEKEVANRVASQVDSMRVTMEEKIKVEMNVEMEKMRQMIESIRKP